MIDKNNENEKELVDKNELAETEAVVEEVEIEDSIEADDEESDEELVEEDADEIAANILKLKSEKISLENFDWSKYNNKWDVYSNDERSQLETMYDKTLSTIVEN